MTKPLNKELGFEFLVHDLINRVMSDMSKLRAVDLAILVEALARLQYKNAAFVMKGITHETKSKISRFHDTDISRYLWSLAQLGYPNRHGVDQDGLLSTLAWECKKRLRAMNGLDFARIVWAFGVLKFKPIQHLLSIICNHHLEEIFIKGDASVKLLWGFQALDYHPGKIPLIKLSRCFAMDIESILPRDIVTGFLALVSFGLVDDRVPTRIKELVLRAEVPHWTPREAANLIWALARADFLEQDTFMILRRFLLDCKVEELPESHQVDIYRCFLHLYMFRPTMARFLPETIGERCQKAWMQFQQRDAQSSVVPEVMGTLQDIGYEVEISTPLHGGILFANTASSGVDLAVEVLSPPHTFGNEQRLTTDGQFWREDVLTSWGWKVLRIEEKRWTRIKEDLEKEEFLKLQIQRS